jgi:hypothetical protein
MTELGFVVIEYNQASHRPAVLGPLTDTRLESLELLKGYEDESREYGRRDSYAVAKVVELEPFDAAE